MVGGDLPPPKGEKEHGGGKAKGGRESSGCGRHSGKGSGGGGDVERPPSSGGSGEGSRPRSSGGGTSVVYVKSPAKKEVLGGSTSGGRGGATDGGEHGGLGRPIFGCFNMEGEADMPGNVRSLLARFGTQASGEVARPLSFTGAGAAMQPGRGMVAGNPAHITGGGCLEGCNLGTADAVSGEGRNDCMQGVLGDNLIVGLQACGGTMDSAMAEGPSSEMCSSSVCGNASVQSAHISAERMQDVCGFAPTVSDVQFSLARAGILNSVQQGPLGAVACSRGSGSEPMKVDDVIGSSGGLGGLPEAGSSGGARVDVEMGSCPSLGDAVNVEERVGHGVTDGVRPVGSLGGACKRAEPIKIEKVITAGDVSEDGISVSLNPASVNRNLRRLERALVGSLLGRRFPFGFLNDELRRRWLQFGEFQLILTGPDRFICVFEEEVARDAVLMGGPWFVAGQVIGMDKWRADASPASLDGFSAPVWIRMPHLPLLYWDNDNITRIAAMVGQPLWIDAHSSHWGRSSYARVCVRLDLSKKLKSGVSVIGVNGRFVQPIEYEGLSQVCFRCGLVGHEEQFCTSAPPAGRNVAATGGIAIAESSSVMEGAGHALTTGVVRGGVGDKGKAGMAEEATVRGDVASEMAEIESTESARKSVEAACSEPELGPWILVARRKAKAQPGGPCGGGRGAPTTKPKTGLGQNLTPHVAETGGRARGAESSGAGTSQGGKELCAAGSTVGCAGDGQMPAITRFSAKGSGTSLKTGVGKSRAGKARVSKAYMDKQLLMLGPIETHSRNSLFSSEF